MRLAKAGAPLRRVGEGLEVAPGTWVQLQQTTALGLNIDPPSMVGQTVPGAVP